MIAGHTLILVLATVRLWRFFPLCGGHPPSTKPTMDDFIAQAHVHRQAQNLAYPTDAELLRNLPLMLRAVADRALSGEATAEEIAYSLASLIDVLDHRIDESPLVRPPDAALH